MIDLLKNTVGILCDSEGLVGFFEKFARTDYSEYFY